jgi:hypothetical protein
MGVTITFRDASLNVARRRRPVPRLWRRFYDWHENPQAAYGRSGRDFP